MPEKNLYEYAVIRYVPDIEREEFVNVGLIMMCKRRRWISVRFHIDQTRLQALRAPHSAADIDAQLAMFQLTASGNRVAGAMGQLPVEERFRWLVAVKSACLQTSRPHPGLTESLDDTFEALFRRLVL